MIYLELAGYVSAFIGAVLLSAGLLRSEEQIKDEEAAYYDGNPFIINGALKSQPYYRYGFRLLIISFSINIALTLIKIIVFQMETLFAILITITMTSIGLLFIQWFEKKREVSHRRFKSQLIDNSFFIRLKHIHTETTGQLVSSTTNTIEYNSFKNNIVSELKDRKNFVNDIYISDLNQLINDLENSQDFNTFFVFLEEYLKDLKIIN